MSHRSSSSQNLPRIRDILGDQLRSSSGHEEGRPAAGRAPHPEYSYPGAAPRTHGQAPGVPVPPQHTTNWHPSGGAVPRQSQSIYTQPHAPSRSGAATPGPAMSHYPGGQASHRNPSVPTLSRDVDWHAHGPRSSSSPHVNEQTLRSPTPGARPGYGPTSQLYGSPQGALVMDMRAPGSTPMASSSSTRSSFPVIPEDQQPNARYICASCGKRFTRPSSLRTHEHSHTGVKPFVCTYPGCGRSFSVQSNMRRHVVKVHERGGSSRQGESSEDEYEDESEISARH